MLKEEEFKRTFKSEPAKPDFFDNIFCNATQLGFCLETPFREKQIPQSCIKIHISSARQALGK